MALVKIGLFFFSILILSCAEKTSQSMVLIEELSSRMPGDYQLAAYNYKNDLANDTVEVQIANNVWNPHFTYSYSIRSDQNNIVKFSVDYYRSDSLFCDLYKIEILQEWSIFLEGNIFKLYTKDYCGNNNTFDVNYSNLRHEDPDHLNPDHIDGVYADLVLVNQNSEIVLNNVLFHPLGFNFIKQSTGIEYFYFSKIN